MVNFEFDSIIISEDAIRALDELAQKAREVSQEPIIAIGYTDNIGSPDYNLKLSMRRANAVRDYLVRNGGLNPAQIVVDGKGINDPIWSNKTEDGRARNRRVEISVKLIVHPHK